MQNAFARACLNLNIKLSWTACGSRQIADPGRLTTTTIMMTASASHASARCCRGRAAGPSVGASAWAAESTPAARARVAWAVVTYVTSVTQHRQGVSRRHRDGQARDHDTPGQS